MNPAAQMAKDLYKILSVTNNKQPKPYDSTAKVERIEGNIAWVRIPGSSDVTPIRKTIDAKEGDSVQIRIANGDAWIVGNDTSPPTDDTLARLANLEAKVAKDDAGVAKLTADNAKNAAAIADGKANEAQDMADALDELLSGTITYEYVNGGVTETVFKNNDGTYYYLDNGVEVQVSEDDLRKDSDGNLIENRESNGLDADVAAVDERVDETNASISALQGTVEDNKNEAAANSLIVLRYAKVENGKLIFYGATSQGEEISRMELSAEAIELKAQGATVASMRNESGQGVMQSTYMEQTFVKMKPQGQNAIYQWIAQSNGHLSLKKL